MARWFKNTILGRAYSNATGLFYAGWATALALVAVAVLAGTWGVNGALVGLLVIPAFFAVVFMLTWTNFISMEKR